MSEERYIADTWVPGIVERLDALEAKVSALEGDVRGASEWAAEQRERDDYRAIEIQGGDR